MTTTIILALLITNFLADQLIQLPIVTKAKHDSFFMMAAHVTTWSCSMLVFTIYACIKITGDVTPLCWWALVCTAHFIVDFSLGYIVTTAIKKKQYHHAIMLTVLNVLIMNLIIVKSFFVMVVWN